MIAGFNALTDLLLSFPLLLSSHFVFVPGPLDPWSSQTLPRPALPTTFTSRLTSRIPKARFVSNPCRITYFGLEVVVCREDIMSKMVRNLVTVKDEGKGADMKRYVSFGIDIKRQMLIGSWYRRYWIKSTCHLYR
jgi:DNA polymerase epsilon subunit 2